MSDHEETKPESGPVGPSDVPPVEAEPATDHPKEIGRYRILEPLGEGGMGIVYKAEQRHPVRRLVALKVIKLGMDTREVVAQFEAERKALATLSHPNVAKVFEAGSMDNGRPYFAMELVPGLPVNQYCDQNKLTTRQRLELFIPICHAVQHAHQKGIIHRDLKPTNLLVTMFDGNPIPKVIDFGIAKATNSALTQHTLFTQTGVMVGTPEYMSPEQAMTSGLDVDTRTDIYSLGVVLYELLTGTLPFDRELLRSSTLQAIAQIIKNTEPHKPSQRLTKLSRTATASDSNEAERIAICHDTDSRSLRRELSGDLDWIVLKAMEKDRTRRYETANGLAMDLRRHLDDEPVSARPPSTIYRLSKFTRKHKALVSASAAVVLVLFLGIIGTTVGLVRAVHAQHAEAHERQLAQDAAAEAEQQSKRAEAKEAEAAKEAAKAKALSVFLQDMLLSFSPENAKSPTVSVRQVLDDAIHRLQAALAGQPDAEAAALLTLGKIYVLIALPKPAVVHLQAALELQRQLHAGNDHPDVAIALTYLGDALMRSGDLDAAEPLIAESVAMNRRLHSKDNADLAASLNVMGNLMLRRGKVASAEANYRESLEMHRRLFGESQQVATSLQNLAIVIKEKGDLPASEAMWLDAVAMYRKVLGSDHPRLTYPLNNLAGLASERGDFAAADRYRSEALAIYRKVLGSSHPQVVSELLAIFDYRRRLGDKAGMTSALHEAYDITRKSFVTESLDVMVDPIQIDFRLYVYTQEYSMAETLLQEYDAKLKSLVDPSTDKELTVAYAYLALYRRSHNQTKLAEWQATEKKRFDAAIEHDSADIRVHPQEADRYVHRGKHYGGQGMFAEASADFAKAIQLKPADALTWATQGGLLAYLGDTSEYRAHCQRMIEKFGQSDVGDALDQTARTSLLLPGGDAGALLAMSKRAADKAKDVDRKCWTNLTKALALYRLGEMTQSLDLAEKTKAMGEDQSFTRSVAIDLLLALLHQKQGEPTKAQASFDHAQQRMEMDAAKIGEGDFNWGDLDKRLAYEVLLREARPLIRGDH